MDDRFNTAAGWILFTGIIALGLTSISSRLYHAEQPEKMGYPIEVADAGGAESSGPDLGTLLASADIAAGATDASARCGTCHTFEAGGAAGTGPNLHGVMGQALAGSAGFSKYSSSLKEKGGTWTWDAMNDWILKPKAYVAGTSMGFAGLKDDAKRANILAYLNSLGSNLPLPEPVAEEEPTEEPAADEGVDAVGAPVEGGDISAVEAAGATGDAQPVADQSAATSTE